MCLLQKSCGNPTLGYQTSRSPEHVEVETLVAQYTILHPNDYEDTFCVAKIKMHNLT